jgi:hypothetical protein
MPSVFGGLRFDWNWSWAINNERDVSADAAYDPVHGFAVIPGSEGPAPLHLAIMGTAPEFYS